jgi:ATP-dependent protease Clp ATPase subunit
MVSTENILFVLGGSFERLHNDLDSIVKKRLQHKGRVNEDGSVEIKGFGAEENNNFFGIKFGDPATLEVPICTH